MPCWFLHLKIVPALKVFVLIAAKRIKNSDLAIWFGMVFPFAVGLGW
jgi:hypothetical protein